MLGKPDSTPEVAVTAERKGRRSAGGVWSGKQKGP